MLPAMRARRGGGGGDVRIEGVEGETVRIQLKRNKDNNTLRLLQAVTVSSLAADTMDRTNVQDMLVDGRVQSNEDVKEEESELEDAMQSELELELEGLTPEEQMERLRQHALKGDAKQAKKVEKAEFLNARDQYTEIYMPINGLIIRKRYGFWTWQFIGFCFVQHFVRKFIRKGLDVKKMGAEVRWDHVVTEPEHLLELKAYCCDNCGYTLFPARGRHEHFFDEVDDFKCPECDAPREAFFDANDPNDPHNQFDDDDEDEDGIGGASSTVAAATDVAGGPDAAGSGADSGAASSEVVSAAAGVPTPQEERDPSPSPEPFAEDSAESEDSSSDSVNEPGDEEGDDLLDF